MQKRKPRAYVRDSKIPLTVKAKGALVNGGFAVFGGLLKVGMAFEVIQKRNKVPASGYVKRREEKLYFFRYGFLEDPDIYLPD